MSVKVCQNCGEESLMIDPDKNLCVCESCSFVCHFEVVENQAFGPNGAPLGTLHSYGDFGYRERKLHRSRALIADITSHLNLTSAHATEVTSLASKVTYNNLGSGVWFPLLVSACAVIAMRKNCYVLSLAEATHAICHDPHELGRMVGCVSHHLDLGQLSELDVVRLLEQAVRDCSPFSTLDKEKIDEILGQGRFILHCVIRWFLTTGRHPLPVFVVVLAFFSKVNGLVVRVEEIASNIHAGVSTSRRRHKELIEVLVKVGKKLLPWGNDVTVKNIVHNAPVLIWFMELKYKAKLNRGGDGNDCVADIEINLDDILKPYLDYVGVAPEEFRYFRLGEGNDGDPKLNWDEIEGLKLLVEDIHLSHAYDSVLDRHRLLGIDNEGNITKIDGS